LRRITWLGHATVLIESGEARLLTDPVLRDRIVHLRRRTPTPEHPGQIDGVLISHLHHDHLDKPSLRRVTGGIALVPEGATKYVGAGFDVREVRSGDAVDIAGARVEVVEAWHDGRRRPGPGSEELDTLGYLVDGIWFAGDTDLNDEMAELRGRVDVALIPIWGWGPSLGPGHLDPEGAARALAIVQPRLAIPIHWGTFFPIGGTKRQQRVLVEPPLEFQAHVKALAPSTLVSVIAPGDSLDL
jgi:L-ascorbate metabolism protein UlaG (beta-lactamase superfamily)